MKKFHGRYSRNTEVSLNQLIVSVHPKHRVAVEQTISVLPYVDSSSTDKERGTRIIVYMSDLTTNDDLEELERLCRAIVGQEDENEKEG